MRTRQTNINPRILGYLGRALSLELTAVQQYMTQAKLTELWGMPEAARRFRQEVTEELEHADRIVERMLRLGVAPNASQLQPVAGGHELMDLLRADERMEHEVIALYRDATIYCTRIGDTEHRDFFEQLLDEETGHADEVRQWMREIEQTPAPTYRRTAT